MPPASGGASRAAAGTRLALLRRRCRRLSSPAGCPLGRELSARGFAVVRGALGRDELDALAEQAVAAYACIRSRAYLLAVERNERRWDALLPALATSAFRGSLHAGAAWMPLARRALGDDCVLLLAGMVWADPGAPAGETHADGPALFAGREPLPPHCLNVFVPLVPVGPANGTEFVPGTHRGAATGAAVAPELSPGDALVFDYRVQHRALANATERPRPMLYLVLGKPWFRDVANWPEVASLDFVDVPLHQPCTAHARPGPPGAEPHSLRNIAGLHVDIRKAVGAGHFAISGKALRAGAPDACGGTADPVVDYALQACPSNMYSLHPNAAHLASRPA